MEASWYHSYEANMPHDIKPDQYVSLVELFDEHAKRHGHAVAFINMKAQLTYQALHDHSVNFATYLQSTGLKPGARVAIMMPNLLQYTVAMLGVLRAGMTVVNVNPLYTAPELVHQLNDAGAELIVVVDNFAVTVQKALPSMPTVKSVITTSIGDMMGFRGHFINFAVKYLKKMVPAYQLPIAVRFNDALKKGRKSQFRPVSIQASDAAFLQYTGGTTGVPKGAVLTHYNMIANVLQCSAWVKGYITKDDTVIAALPMYHIFSLTVCCLTFIFLGATCVLITNPRHIPSFFKILKRSHMSVFVGVNTLFNAMMQQPTFDELDFSSLKVTVAGGMALQEAVAERWHERTGCHITEGYGLTEASPVVSINPLSNEKYNGTIGLPIPSTEVMLRKSDGQEALAGEPGELCVRGPQVMQGYWQKPEETANVLDADGWLRTGDVATIDEKGFIAIVDRMKDMILVSGFNVYPNEIESVLAAHPGIRENAVIGLPSETSGEFIKAFVVRDDERLTVDEIRAYCRQHLTRYKVPKQVEFRDELPKSNVGKVLRRALKEEIKQGDAS